MLPPSRLQASFRGDGKSPGVPQKPCSKAAAPTPPKRRNSTLWSETLDVHQKGTFSTKEIKRQEVLLFSLFKVYSTVIFKVQGAEDVTSPAVVFLPQAIHELYRGEQDLIEDLQLARKVKKIIIFNRTKKSKHLCSLFVLKLLLFLHLGIP